MAGSNVVLRGFQAKMESLYDMLAFVREESHRAGFAPKHISKIELASEEALVNIISYAYTIDNTEEDPVVEIECSYLMEGGIKILLKDRGQEYNPLEYHGKFNPKNPTDTKVGGYGIFLITKLMDHVHYERDNGYNVLTLIKRIGS
jgi:anti-sigma regulatory factor (Ser/Thr protein kinase)